MRVALFGGTFDPFHQGHLDVAHAARRALQLDRVDILPSNVPPHRAPPHASAAHRFAMAALGVHGEEGLAVSDLEMLAPGASYTCATLDRLQATGVDTTTACFVIGADAFADIATWRQYPELLDRCHFIVVSRPSRRAPDLRALLPQLAARMLDAPVIGPFAVPPRPAIILVDAPTAPVSSTTVRQHLAAGLSIRGMVPDAVRAHIATHRLYTTPEMPDPARAPEMSS